MSNDSNPKLRGTDIKDDPDAFFDILEDLKEGDEIYIVSENDSISGPTPELGDRELTVIEGGNPIRVEGFGTEYVIEHDRSKKYANLFNDAAVDDNYVHSIELLTNRQNHGGSNGDNHNGGNNKNMTKPIHVDKNLHKAVKVVAVVKEVPMKEIVENLLRGEAEDELIDEIVEQEQRLNQS